MFGAMPGSASCRSPKRRGPSSSASMTSSVHRSPTAARAASSGVSGGAPRGMPTSLRAPSGTVTCKSQVTTLRKGSGPFRRVWVTAISDLQSTIAGVAERVGPSVVGLGRGWSAGSGVVVAPGRVATVAHAVRRGAPTVTFFGGRRAEASIAGIDRDANLALLDIDTGDAPALEPADVLPALGEAVVALADPGGRGLRVTLGFVTSAARLPRGPPRPRPPPARPPSP